MLGGDNIDFIALIPSLNPDNILIELVKKLYKKKFKIIIIDDGSKSNYKNIFNKCKPYAKLLSYKKNMGKGYALKYGLKYIKENYNNSIIVTMDSDGQHSVEDALKLAKNASIKDNTLFLGKRLREKDIPFRSKIGNELTTKVFKIASKIDIYDTQTGLRAFSQKLIDYMINEEGNRYEYEMNVLLHLKENNIEVEEIEIETIYIENNKASHFNTIKDSFRIYKEIIKFSLSSIISFMIDYLLYLILNLLSNNIIISNIIARLISASFNYKFNKHIVFKKKNKALFKYFILALFILIMNTSLLILLTSIGLNKLIAKIIVEIFLFFISYYVQRKVVFK